eukprot:gnl/MRDRNA2_/MRDRNA2_25346_c0_seq1.p1 gnl/MRDRNA2_/MRDRNA2_25346_c0~~gnl/MRDRNA2_/MRDRNA2_25346_c0_seq1.p1  ORF type:complete len:212 (+),score=31.02 gnl/MRDRNA2_/MRDRNA2_25346_c0_seq1:112-747(+)
MAFRRCPFFLRGDQGVIDRWMASIGLPPDAPRYLISERMNWKDDYIDSLFAKAGLSPRDKETTKMKQMADTMDSHRLGRYAASVDSEKCEQLWRALSRRYFMGKDTQIRPIRLDNREMLLECAAEVGLDTKEALKVLETDVYRKEILDEVEQMKAAGVNSIPVIVFEVDGVAVNSWLRSPKSRGREIFQGSGSRQDFYAILRRLHAACPVN